MKTLRIIQRIALMLLSAVGIATVLATVICLAMNIRPVVVVSGSMEPELPVGALVLHQAVPASELEVGDVVTVPRNAGEGVVTHRVAGIEKTDSGEYALTLRGDANKKDDPEQYVVSKADRLVTSFPVLGGVLLWMRANPIPAAAALLALLIFSLWPAPRFSVHLPDGRVIKNLTRREAEAHAAAHRASGDDPQPGQPAGTAGASAPAAATQSGASWEPADPTQPIAPVAPAAPARLAAGDRTASAANATLAGPAWTPVNPTQPVPPVAPTARLAAGDRTASAANAGWASAAAPADATQPGAHLRIPRAATPAGVMPPAASPRQPRRIPYLPVNAA